MLSNLLGAPIPLLACCNCSRFGHSLIRFLRVSTMTLSTPKTQAARRLPGMHIYVAQMLKIVALFKPVVGSIIVDLYNYVT
jgi:hypothetical protein